MSGDIAAGAAGAPVRQAQKTWTGWAILAYNLDTLTIRTA